MRAEAFVDEAAVWAKELVRGEARFPGDYLPAMRRVARRIGVPLNLLWGLHYRKPKSLSVEKYAAIAKAYADERRRRYEEERQTVHATTPIGEALLRAADRAAREDDGVIEQ